MGIYQLLNFALLIDVLGAVDLDCSTQSYVNSKGYTCFACCPGFYVFKECPQNGTTNLCKPCDDGKYHSTCAKQSSRCSPCSSCSNVGKKEISKNCTRIQDTECICKEGYFRDNENVCIPSCREGTHIDQEKRRCVPCQAGTSFSSVRHALECQKCTNCTNYKTNCTTTSDSVCNWLTTEQVATTTAAETTTITTTTTTTTAIVLGILLAISICVCVVLVVLYLLASKKACFKNCDSEKTQCLKRCNTCCRGRSSKNRNNPADGNAVDERKQMLRKNEIQKLKQFEKDDKEKKDEIQKLNQQLEKDDKEKKDEIQKLKQQLEKDDKEKKDEIQKLNQQLEKDDKEKKDEIQNMKQQLEEKDMQNKDEIGKLEQLLKEMQETDRQNKDRIGKLEQQLTEMQEKDMQNKDEIGKLEQLLKEMQPLQEISHKEPGAVSSTGPGGNAAEKNRRRQPDRSTGLSPSVSPFNDLKPMSSSTNNNGRLDNPGQKQTSKDSPDLPRKRSSPKDCVSDPQNAGNNDPTKKQT